MAVFLPLPSPLVPARFVARPNRFLLEVRLESSGDVQSVHLADPGRLRELLRPGRRLWLRRSTSPTRTTSWSAVLVESPVPGEWVSLDSTLPNRLIRKALEEQALEEFRGWSLEGAEVTLGRSRIDFVLRRGPKRRLALEVKSVTLVEEGVALFPDAVTARGARHVAELARLAGEGDWESAILFVVQRSDAREVHAARHIDATFAQTLLEASRAGVRVLGRRCRVELDRITLADPIPAKIV